MHDPASRRPAGAASDPALDPATVQAAAEEVRAWLVTVRGSAPFLSSADGRLLLEWLQAGVPVGAIIAAIDTVAERRRRRRSRRRLTLKDCRKAVEAARRRPEDRPRAGAGPEHFEPPATDTGGSDALPHPGLRELAAEVRGSDVPAHLIGARDAAADVLHRLAADPRHADEIGRDAAAAVRSFHEAAWEASAHEHEALRAAAAEELAPMRTGLRPREWEGLVEEVARDHLRRRTPAMSGRRVWDTLAG